MTNPTPHGQVPEALRLANLCSNLTRYSMDAHLIAAELRRQHARIAELEAQIEALSGVQALSAAPEAIAKLRHLYQNMVNGAVRDTASAKRIAEGLLAPAIEALERATPPAEQAAPKAAPGVTSEQRRLIGVIADKIEDGTLFQSGIYPKKDLARFVRNMLDTTPTAPAASPTPPAEQQAAPKAAPGELSADSLRHQNKLLAETLGACILASGIVRKDIDGFTGPELLHFGEDLRSMLEVAPQQEAQEPVATLHCNDIGYVWARATEVGTRMRFEQPINLYTAPQPAPAPLSEMPYEKRKAIQEGEQIGASDAWFKARHEMLDTVDRRNVFRAGFDRGWNAAIAAQGGKDA